MSVSPQGPQRQTRPPSPGAHKENVQVVLVLLGIQRDLVLVPMASARLDRETQRALREISSECAAQTIRCAGRQADVGRRALGDRGLGRSFGCVHERRVDNTPWVRHGLGCHGRRRPHSRLSSRARCGRRQVHCARVLGVQTMVAQSCRHERGCGAGAGMGMGRGQRHSKRARGHGAACTTHHGRAS